MAAKHVVSSDKKYCMPFCTLKDSSTSKWIACDGIDCPVEWYHCECVDIDAADLPPGDWMCPPCVAALKGARPKTPRRSPAEKGIDARNKAFDKFAEQSLEDISRRKREIEMDIAREELRGMELKLELTKRGAGGSGMSGGAVSARDFEELLGKLACDDRGSDGKRQRSGLYEVARHQVRVTQEWPHKNLDMEYSSQGINFKDLSMPQFVAGEINIIKNSDEEGERKGRLDFLKALMYEAIACKKLPWSVILDCYSGWLLEVERGRQNWGDDFSSMIGGIVRRASYDLLMNTKSTSLRDGHKFLWYCSEFNRGACDLESPHMSTTSVRGMVREVVHMCATCYTAKKVERHHSERSSECPLRAKEEGTK